MKKLILIPIVFFIVYSSAGFSQTFSSFDTAQFTAFSIYNAMDLKSMAVKDKAYTLTADYANDYTEQVITLFDYMYYNWKYESDPNGIEYFAPAAKTLETMTGDCDDYAIVMVSMLSSLGGDGRVICVSGHAYPELYLGTNLNESSLHELQLAINNHYEKLSGRKNKVKKLHYRKDYDGSFWLNLDWQSSHPGGRWVDDSEEAKFLVIYTNGIWREGYLNKE
jgi:hypothetical protein